MGSKFKINNENLKEKMMKEKNEKIMKERK